ncbi:hypothetical protein SETIT_2G160000v2 [Setaria italica]|uniref:ENT domain-containing protein n=2 Tax=Setaria italica TaxID=4555 RepID=A0A368PZB8_SETIT|nr:hypothetical protein SETIT_2G160000v2 [Setaria italica]
MPAFGRLCDRVPLLDITKRSGQHVNYENSLCGQKSNGSCYTDAAIVTGNPYMPRVMRLQEQGSSEPYELNNRYNAPTAKNIGDLNGMHSWVQEHPEERKMIQTSLELLMSQSKNVQPPIFSGSFGGDLSNAPTLQVQGTAYSSKGHKMIQTPLVMLVSQSRNVCPPNLSGSTYSSNGHRMIQTPSNLLMSESRNVGLTNYTGSVGGEPTNIPSSQVHGTAYSSRGHKMIQTPWQMLMSGSRNVCPPNLSGSTYAMEMASLANPQVHSTSYSSRGHRMIQTPTDQMMSESFNAALPNSTGSAVGGEPTNIPSSQVHGTVYSSKGHEMIQTPLEMLMSQSTKPNLSGSTFGVELASVANPQVHNTVYSSRGHRMIQTPMDLLMLERRNFGPPNSTVSAVSVQPTNVPSSQVNGSAYSSSETDADNDLPPPSLNSRDTRGSGCVSGEGRATIPASSHARVQTDMEAQIHQLEHGTNNDDDLPPPSPNGSDMRVHGHVSDDGRAIVPASSYARAHIDMDAQVHHLELGTDGDDDPPPPYSNSRDMRGSGHVCGDGRAIVTTSSHARAPTDMEAQIHQLEQQAYYLVLRAFKARSDSITWEKEDLITELREELRVSDEAHQQLLNMINNDDLTHSIRERRTTGGIEERLPNNPSHDSVSNHTTSARKRQKTSKSITASLATPTQPSSSTAIKAVSLGTKGKRTKPCQKVSGGSAVKPTSSSEGPSARGPLMNRYFPGGPSAEFSEAQNVNPLIGRKVMNRWPDDNSFYEVVISDYNPETGLYALVYDINTSNETWEWVDLEKMGPEDIRWLDNDSGIDPVMYLQSQGAPSSGARKSTNCGGLMRGHGRGRSFQKNVSKKDFSPPQKNARKRGSGDIDILHTESLIERVEKVFNVSNPDHLEVEKAKKALKEQEHSLVDAIARLAEASADETDGHNRCHRKKNVRRS